MGILERDPDATADTLRRWFADVAGVEDPEIRDVTVPGSTGWSNETILFDAEWGADAYRRNHELVVRIAPSGHQVFPEDTFLRQHAVMHALGERSDVPMATVHHLDTDETWFGRPFWVMDRIAGDIVTDTPPYAGHGWLFDAAPAEQRRVWDAGIDAMAAVHRVDLDHLALPAGTFAAGAETVDAHLDHWERFLAWGEDGTPHPASREALARLLADRPAEPSEGHALVWGDARFSNLIYRDREVVAVLDWEMAAIGDPLLDLGWWIFADQALTVGSDCTRLPGFPTAAETAERWEAATGRSAGALAWFELFGGLRFTVIMLRMGHLLADLGFVPPEFARDNLISRSLDRLLAER